MAYKATTRQGTADVPVPAGVPHCFRNRGEGTMTIYWVYGGRDVTRTITATGETFEHLSESDRGAVPSAERPS
jgi:HTH-type transcriptional repressor of puuD